MNVRPSDRLSALKDYPFAVMDERIAELQNRGVDVIDFGVGSPRLGLPGLIREALKRGVDEFTYSGYPEYRGMRRFREAASAYLKRKFGVDIDPDREVLICAGTKELLFHLPEAFLNPGDYALVTTPGFAPCWRGVLFAEGRCHLLPITEENDYLPDLTAVDEDMLDEVRYIVVNYPNNPTGRVAPYGFYEELLDFAERNDIFVVSDEAYIELYFTREPTSMLSLRKEGVISLFSFSKRSAMANYRVGFAAGDERIISTLAKLKSNIDSGIANAIQYAAIEALFDDEHTEFMRRRWEVLISKVVDALSDSGLDAKMPEGTFYIWQRVPSGYDGVTFALELLERCGIGVMPGEWLSAPSDESAKEFVRISINEPEERVEEAVRRISTEKW